MITRRAFTAGIATALVSVPLRARAQSAPGLVQGLEGNGISPELRAAPWLCAFAPAGKDADVWTLRGRLAPCPADQARARAETGPQERHCLCRCPSIFHGVRGPNADGRRREPDAGAGHARRPVRLPSDPARCRHLPDPALPPGRKRGAPGARSVGPPDRRGAEPAIGRSRRGDPDRRLAARGGRLPLAIRRGDRRAARQLAHRQRQGGSPEDRGASGKPRPAQARECVQCAHRAPALRPAEALCDRDRRAADRHLRAAALLPARSRPAPVTT